MFGTTGKKEISDERRLPVSLVMARAAKPERSRANQNARFIQVIVHVDLSFMV